VLGKILALTMEWRPMQSCEDGNDEELVYFPGATDKGAADDHQYLKLYAADKFGARMVGQVIQ
jgi:hypothetical protein